MHSPRLQMKKKGELSPRTLQPVVSSTTSAKPPPQKGGALGSVPLGSGGGGSSSGGEVVGSMTSDAIAGLLGKYRTTIDNDVLITAAELSGVGGPNRTAQEIARVAQALSPRKPDEPPPPDPYQDVGSRVFDFMKKSPTQQPVVVVGGSSSSSTTSPRQPSFSNLKPVGNLLPLTHHNAPLMVDAPAMYTMNTTQQQQQQQQRRNLAPLPQRDGTISYVPQPPHQHHQQQGLGTQIGNSSSRIPAAPQTGGTGRGGNGASSSAAAFTSRYVAPDERALALLPATSTTTSGGGALTIVQSPRDALPQPYSPTNGTKKEGSLSDLLREIETTTKDEQLSGGEGGALLANSASGGGAGATFVDPELRRERLVHVLNSDNFSRGGGSQDDDIHQPGVKSQIEISKLTHHIAFLTQQLLYHGAASPAALDAAVAVVAASSPSATDAGTDAVVPSSAEGGEGDGEVPVVTDCSSPFEVTISRNGRVVWRASTQEVDLSLIPGNTIESSSAVVAGTTTTTTSTVASIPTAKTTAAPSSSTSNLKVEDVEEAWLLSDASGGEEVVDESVNAVKTRARKAYTKAISGYKLKLTQQRDVIAKLKAQIETTQAGGTKFNQLEEDLQIVREECRKQLGKIKTLVSLLDRAGQTIRYHEDQRHADAMGNAIRKEGAAQWSQVRRIMPALDVEPPRTDAHILVDVLRFMDQQEDKLAEYSSHTEQLTTQLEEAQSAFDALQRTTKALQRDLEQTKFELEALRQRRKFEQDERSSTLATAVATPQQQNISSTNIKPIPGGGLTPSAQPLTLPNTATSKAANDERMRLMERISSLESALKATTELKSTFSPFGVVDAIPPFLRYPKTSLLRNLQLSKMEVENIICGIWLTRFLSSVQNSKPITESGWVVQENGAVGPDGKKVTSNFANGSAVVKSLERMFTLAVQTVFTSAAGSSAGSFYGRGGASEIVASPSTSAAASTTTATAPSSTYGSPNSIGGGPQLSPDRHPACDFTDENNISLWQVKRSEAKRVVNMMDHVTRFFLECIQPSACKTCLTLYTLGSGIATPPIATLQWQKRTDLFLQCPQVPTLFRGQGTAVPEAVAEVTYSFVDGCDKYNFDGDINMFRRILQDEIPEAAYFDMMLMVEKLRGALINSHTLYASPYRWPTPTVATVLHMLKRFFPKKSRTSLLQLQRSLLLDMKETAMSIDAAALARMMRSASNFFFIKDLPRVVFGIDGVQGGDDQMSDPNSLASEAADAALRTPVDVVKLFASSESGNQGYFVESLKSQYMNELVRYTQEVREAVVACSEELTHQQAAKESAGVTTGIDMIDAKPLTTLEKSKRRRSTVASYFQKQLAALTSSGDDREGGPFSVDGGADAVIPLRALVDKLQSIDPAKSTTDVESYIYHVLQLYFLIKSKKSREAGASSTTSPTDPSTPLNPGLTPAESELFSLSREELWKRQTRAASYGVSVADFTKYCGKVLYRRSAVDFYEEQ
ncbi:Hypothetical protein, putative [Bodo saltans]|uniref:Uncharacterized protein n=1 Tax=Bodo saltans TaxID=75058 RepID=A0A0S4IIR7_BODSA|nr:Hypothetical protein, putative [Bodo saltans]|eukprot:CUE72953.1 Hypothetical protein, putative [Bodo saltans]